MEGSKTPAVSVVIPMYNAGQFVGPMIDSVIKQTFIDWELLIVDDGSTDNSRDVVEKYCKEDGRIRLIRRSDDRIKGACTCRNIGFEHSKGKYVIWLDADDLIAPYCLEQRVKFMDANECIDVAVFPLVSFKYCPWDDVGFALGFEIPRDLLSFFIQQSIWFAVATNIYRTNTLKENSIRWSEGLSSRQDGDFNITCFCKNLIYQKGDGLPDYFYRTADNHDSISKKINKGKSRATLKYFDLQYDKLSDLQKSIIAQLVYYVFDCVRIQNDIEVIKEFFEKKYFVSHLFVKYRFKAVLLLCGSNSGMLVKLVKMFLFPFSFYKYRHLEKITLKKRNEWCKYAIECKKNNIIM